MHGRNLETMERRIRIMPGRSASGFHLSGRYCLYQARRAVSCAASRIKGKPSPHYSALVRQALACCAYFLAYGSQLIMISPVEYTLLDGVIVMNFPPYGLHYVHGNARAKTT